MRRLMPDDSPKTLLVATGLGAASSSCSYASVALARSLCRKGVNFTAAMVFEIASTKLVIELGIIMWVLLGWRFVLGEFVGGPLMIVLLALRFRRFLKRQLVEEGRAEAEKGRLGWMEGMPRWTCPWRVTEAGGGGCARRSDSRRPRTTS
jgi:uncharacterized membrane protein YraQ (UPF0718 family)